MRELKELREPSLYTKRETMNTLYIGLYEGDDGSAATSGTLCKANGSLEPDVLGDAAPTAWAALAQSLIEAELLQVRHVVICTHVVPVLVALGRPAAFKPNTDDQWNVLRLLVGYQCRGGTWQTMRVDEDKLQKARERWQEQQR